MMIIAERQMQLLRGYVSNRDMSVIQYRKYIHIVEWTT